MFVRGTATKTNVCLDCRTAKMAIENCLRGLKPDALVLAVQQLAQTLYSARRQFTQRSLDHLGHTRPATRIGAAAGEPVSALVAFHYGSPLFLKGQNILREARHDWNARSGPRWSITIAPLE